ncbi:MAG TPA: hypothetical protein VLA46_03250 [Saprospiraceae bacterium]|nr:hypothetical protein [Saprospiraceae bacterium]
MKHKIFTITQLHLFINYNATIYHTFLDIVRCPLVAINGLNILNFSILNTGYLNENTLSVYTVRANSFNSYI